MPVHPLIAAKLPLLEGIASFVARCALAGVDVQQLTAVRTLHAFLDPRPDIEPVEPALTLMADVVATSRTPETLEVPA